MTGTYHAKVWHTRRVRRDNTAPHNYEEFERTKELPKRAFVEHSDCYAMVFEQKGLCKGRTELDIAWELVGRLAFENDNPLMTPYGQATVHDLRTHTTFSEYDVIQVGDQFFVSDGEDLTLLPE